MSRPLWYSRGPRARKRDHMFGATDDPDVTDVTPDAAS
jgi:hypothetical protein